MHQISWYPLQASRMSEGIRERYRYAGADRCGITLRVAAHRAPTKLPVPEHQERPVLFVFAASTSETVYARRSIHELHLAYRCQNSSSVQLLYSISVV